MTKQAELLLQAAVSFRSAPERTTPLPDTFNDAADAVAEWMQVLLHEARDAMQTPITSAPEQPYLHPVDVDTDEPGIVDHKDRAHVQRYKPPFQAVVYRRPGPGTTEPYRGTAVISQDAAARNPEVVTRDNLAKAKAMAEKAHAKALQRLEKRAASTEERMERTETQKRARAEETPEQRRQRLEEAKAKREERARLKASEPPKPPKADKPALPTRPPPSEDVLLCPATDAILPPTRARLPGGKVQFYPHPLPHHRHLEALEHSMPNDALLPALLDISTCEGVSIIQGPPGTGKTRALVDCIADTPGRILLCAPTNVGTANLYARCLAQGWGDNCALTIAPERVPSGTVVLSNDPRRRLVCATISSRSGPVLHTQVFDAVFVDEAAQCMEALVWGLLRPAVRKLVLAGDVQQLPATVSESGRKLHHERSLMERLLGGGYENTVRLTVQNRMAPALLTFPNDEFYEGELTSGPHAPTEGHPTVRCVDCVEEQDGTSFCNRGEARAACEEALALCEEIGSRDVVLITPYTAQCRILLAQKTGLEVHTIDSFQGREADGVVLSVVRSGESLGFWSDARRSTVALTRAKRRLVVIASNPHRWPKNSPLSALVEHCTSRQG